MATFDLYEDYKFTNWRRCHYLIEADSLEEAVEKIKDGAVDCEYSECLDCEEWIDPNFHQNGETTHEIYNSKDDKLVYTNELQVQ